MSDDQLDPHSTDPFVKQRLKELAEKREAAALQRQQPPSAMSSEKEVNVDTVIHEEDDDLQNENENGNEKDLGKNGNKGGSGKKKSGNSNANSNLNNLGLDGNDNKMELEGGLEDLGNERRMGRKRQFSDEEAMEKARQQHVHNAMGQYFRKEINYEQLQVILHSLDGDAANSGGGHSGNSGMAKKKRRKRGGRRASGMVSINIYCIFLFYVVFFSFIFILFKTEYLKWGLFPLKTK